MKTFECQAEVPISLPLEEAWRLLADLRRWSSWNPFVTRVRGAPRPRVGAVVEIDVSWGDGSGTHSTEEIVDLIEGGTVRGFRWDYRGPLHRLGLLRASRLIAVEYVSPDSCRYVSSERFFGPLVGLLPRAKITDGFERMAAAFAGACDRAKAKAEPTSAEAAACPHARAASLDELPPPPMVSGALPVAGHLVEFKTRHRELFERGYAEHGPVFGVAFGPWKCAVVAGPEHNAIFYGRTDHELRTDRAYAYLRKMFGRVGLTHEPEGYAAERHILTAPFKPKAMTANLQAIDEEVERFIAGLGERGELELVPAMQGLMQQISAHVLMGREFRERMDEEFWSLYDDLAKGLDAALPPWLPLPRFIRRDIARAKLHRKLRPIIEERRRRLADQDEGADLLQILVAQRLADGELLPVERVIDYVISMVFAGFETTAGHVSWALIHVLQHRAVQAELERVVEETLGAGAPMSREALASLEPLRHAVRETERLQPVADRHVRSVHEPIEIGGYRIPEGWVVMSAVALTHRMPELYANPSSYDPSRFARGEGGKYALVGFGAGRHRCTGVTLAYNEMTIVLARMLQRLDLELVSPRSPRVASTDGVLLPEPTRVAFRAREAARSRS